MSLLVLTRKLIPALWVCRCSSASTCREASDALSKSSANYTCLDPPASSKPIIVRIMTAGTDDESCRIAVIARMNVACEMSPFLSSILRFMFVGLCVSPTSTPPINSKRLPAHRRMGS